MKNIKLFGRVLKSELYVAFTSPIIYVSVIGIVFLSYFSSYQYINEISLSSDANSLYIFNLEIGDGWYIQLQYLLSALPAALSFYGDWKNSYYIFCAIRLGADAYCYSKCISCIIITFLTMLIGLSVFTFYICVTHPFVPNSLENTTFMSIYYSWVYNGHIIQYVIIHIILVCIGAMIWSSVGLLFTIYQPDIYVAITTPFVSSYIMCRIMYNYLPDVFNLDRLVSGRVLVGNNELTTLGFTLIYILSILSLLIFCISRQVRRRLQNEVI